MPLFYRILADAVVVLHATYVWFVILGQLAIVIGMVLRWKWIRNMTFRVTHLAAILIVVLEAWWGFTCPLTTWERHLRELSGEATYQGDFIANWVHNTLFYTAPSWVFTVCYSGFGALVLLSFILAPPRRKKSAANSPKPDAGQTSMSTSP
jgi:hypothetical protein